MAGSCQADDEYVIVPGREIFAGVSCVAAGESGVGDGVCERQVAGVVRGIRDFSWCRAGTIAEFQVEVCQCLIAAISCVGCLFLGCKVFIHNLLSFCVLPFGKQSADFREAFGCIGIPVVGLVAAPHGNLVQHYMVSLHSAVRHHAQTSVSERQGLFPDCCRELIIHPVIDAGSELSC